MTSKPFRLSILVPLFLATASLTLAQTGSAAQTQATTEENAQERINLSGKLRMLSQRIPSAACHLNKGIDPEGARTLLIGATAEFERILTALEFGDPELNIMNAETGRRALQRVHQLREIWQPLKSAASSLVDGTATQDDIEYILTQNIPVLQDAQLLVEELVKAYSNPNAVPRAMLMLVDISGRQRMLTQKMSKESCMIGGEYASPQTVSDLAGTVQIFEASLDALKFGLPAVGILPPPNGQISDGLIGVDADWTSVKPMLTDIIAGNALASDAETAKFQGLNVTMANMNTVVGMYADAAQPN